MEYSRHVDPGWRLIFLILKGLVGHPMVSYCLSQACLGMVGKMVAGLVSAKKPALGQVIFKCSVDCVSYLCL